MHLKTKYSNTYFSGRYYYHGILALSKNIDNKICCAGNSSSGIKETPAFNCPTVNMAQGNKEG